MASNKLGDASSPTLTYSGLPYFDEPDFIDFLELISNNKIETVLYPKLDGYSDHGWQARFHPLHPNYLESEASSQLHFANLFSRLLSSGTSRKPIPSFEPISEALLQADRVAQHWKLIKKNKFYKIISNTDGFKNAHKLFLKKRNNKQNNQYKNPDSEFRFIHSVGFCIAAFELSRGKAFTKNNASKTSIRSAIKHIQKLNQLFSSGIELENSQDQWKLDKLLTDLSSQLAERDYSGRKPWTGEKSKYRYFVQTFAGKLERHFGEASPKIIYEISNILGCEIDIKTIENYVKVHRRENLIKGMIAYRKNSAKKG